MKSYGLKQGKATIFLPMARSGEVVDRRGQVVKYFKDVPKVLAKLKADGYIIAVASRFDNKVIDRMLEMTLDAPTNVGKHMRSTIACALNQLCTKDLVF